MKTKLLFSIVCLFLFMQAHAVIINNFVMEVEILNPLVPGHNYVQLCPGTTLQVKNRTTYGNNWPADALLTGYYKFTIFNGSLYYTPTISASSWTYGQTWTITIPPSYAANSSPYNCYFDYVLGSGQIPGSNNFFSDLNYVRILPIPTLTVSPSTSVCAGSSTTLSVSGGTSYTWAPASGLSCTTCSNPVATPTATTTYTVTGTNANGCTSTKTVTVTVNPLPGITFTPNGQTICKGNPVSISASVSGGGSITYQWEILNNASLNTWTTLGSVANNISMSGAAYNPYVQNSPYNFQYLAYRLTVSNGTCSNSAITIVFFNQPVTYSFTDYVQVCYTGSVPPPPAYFAVNAPNAWGFQWQYRQNPSLPWANCSGSPFTNYTTSTLCIANPSSLMNGWQMRCVLEGNNCPDVTTNIATLYVLACGRMADSNSSQDEVVVAPTQGKTWSGNVTSDLASVAFALLQTSDDGGTTWRTVGSAYPDANGELITSTTEDAISNYGNVQWVTVKNDGTVEITNAKLGASEVSQNVQLNVYPNPASDQLNIDGISGNSVVTIFSMDGRLISRTACTTSLVAIETASLEAGMYIVQVEDANGIRTKQFVKQ